MGVCFEGARVVVEGERERISGKADRLHLILHIRTYTVEKGDDRIIISLSRREKKKFLKFLATTKTYNKNQQHKNYKECDRVRLRVIYVVVS